jgi:nucleotide-binding universal stress UspA family protein
VAERVLHGAHCPVLVVRSPSAVRRILIPLDGSECSERALGPGLEVAAALGGEVTLLRAVPRVHADKVQGPATTERGLGRRQAEEVRGVAEDYLRRQAEMHETSGLNIQFAITDEPAAQNILKYAETGGIDLIVMSTHGRTGLRRWVYGSVTEKVLHSASSSMLVVRPPLAH